MKLLGRFLILGLSLAAAFAISLGEAGADGKEIRSKTYWQKRYVRMLTRKAEAELRVEENQKVIREARQRDRLKGEHRVEIMTEQESAEKELAEVTKLLAEFPDTARKAGIPPGWLREVDSKQGRES